MQRFFNASRCCAHSHITFGSLAGVYTSSFHSRSATRCDYLAFMMCGRSMANGGTLQVWSAICSSQTAVDRKPLKPHHLSQDHKRWKLKYSKQRDVPHMIRSTELKLAVQHWRHDPDLALFSPWSIPPSVQPTNKLWIQAKNTYKAHNFHYLWQRSSSDIISRFWPDLYQMGRGSTLKLPEKKTLEF